MFGNKIPKIVLSLCVTGALSSTLLQADDRRIILDHRAPTGVAGQWSAMTRPGVSATFQPLKVSLPSTGRVDFHRTGSAGLEQIPQPSPALVALSVGHVYRVRISEMPEFPGVELFPTVELLDRLYAPEGLENEFPIPIQITAEEINTVLQHRMVTKVVYLEQPNLAFPEAQEGTNARIENLPPTTNLLQAADLRGRPMAIVRIGGRVPDKNGMTDEFYTSSPIQIPAR